MTKAVLTKPKPARVLFASAVPERLERSLTLPARFQRLLGKLALRKKVAGKTVAVKMHLGGGLGYSTIHPLFVRLLVSSLREAGAKKVFVSDCGNLKDASHRGYTSETVGAPLVPALGLDEKKLKDVATGWEPLPAIELGRPILDAEVLINLSHIKGHGDAGFGGACKNLGMGCVSSRTRGKIHGLEGDLTWASERCTRCGKCVSECQMEACSFDKHKNFTIFWHNCKLCQHCALICPHKAITISNRNFALFQEGLARVAREVIRHYGRGNVLHINFLTQITIFCDCWGLTTPALVPDVGIYAGGDIVAVEQATLDAIRTEKLIPGALTPPYTLGKGRHLFEKIHGRDPYEQVEALSRLGCGRRIYTVEEIA